MISSLLDFLMECGQDEGMYFIESLLGVDFSRIDFTNEV